ncbi:MAG: hypothetical protein OXT67_03760 [Zetaproteobacteria bacterium]|nr:hypothetical protein [Zetaproteobacteria bacterium]
MTLYLCVHANFVENSIWRDEQDLQRLFALSTDPRIPSPCILVLQRERLQAGDERALARRVNLCLQKWQLQVKDLDVHDWLRSALGKKIDKYFAFSSRI